VIFFKKNISKKLENQEKNVVIYRKVETYTFNIEIKIEMPPTIFQKQQLNKIKTSQKEERIASCE
jgi:hypothetical protein